MLSSSSVVEAPVIKTGMRLTGLALDRRLSLYHSAAATRRVAAPSATTPRPRRMTFTPRSATFLDDHHYHDH